MPPKHSIDIDELVSLEWRHRDTTPPGKVKILGRQIWRGVGESCETKKGETWCGYMVGAWLGSITLRVRAPSDARTAAKNMGYRLTFVRGKLPCGFKLPTYDVAAPSGWILIKWDDGLRWRQEPFSFVLNVSAVDAAGNVGQPRKMRVSHRGRGSRPTSGPICR